jgi:hypothetical protein
VARRCSMAGRTAARRVGKSEPREAMGDMGGGR